MDPRKRCAFSILLGQHNFLVKSYPGYPETEMCRNHPSSKKIGFYNRRRNLHRNLSQKPTTECRKRPKDPGEPSPSASINSTAPIFIQRTQRKEVKDYKSQTIKEFAVKQSVLEWLEKPTDHEACHTSKEKTITAGKVYQL